MFLVLYCVFLLALVVGAIAWPRLRWPLLTVFALMVIAPMALIVCVVIWLQGADVKWG